ncbi:VWA domain-containing protein [Kitasatospora sp. NBC_00374]|uniref:VWA domain-containing protein n=1 Tax=Kitasatospora sp. NBC_00374 TaxID=2975964 RepID=UPI003250A24A
MRPGAAPTTRPRWRPSTTTYPDPETPALVNFQTDGEPQNRQAAEDALRAAAHLPIFWAFVGFGPRIEFLRQLDTLQGRLLDNALVVLRAPDSSAVAMDARFDGERLLRACCEPHLARLVAAYQHRRFVAEELWAGQITRAVRLLGPLDEEEMYDRVVAVIGLDEEQLMRAVAWQGSHSGPSGPG